MGRRVTRRFERNESLKNVLTPCVGVFLPMLPPYHLINFVCLLVNSLIRHRATLWTTCQFFLLEELITKYFSSLQINQIFVKWHNEDAVLATAHPQCWSRLVLNLGSDPLIYNGRPNRECHMKAFNLLSEPGRNYFWLTLLIILHQLAIGLLIFGAALITATVNVDLFAIGD